MNFEDVMSRELKKNENDIMSMEQVNEKVKDNFARYMLRQTDFSFKGEVVKRKFSFKEKICNFFNRLIKVFCSE